MVRAIPRRLLIHSAILQSGKTTDKWSNPTWEHEQPITNVRFEPTEKMKLTKENKEIQCTLLMFFDTKNSLPTGLNFEVGQTLHWQGADYDVVGVEGLYDDLLLHHWEVGLV